MHFSLENGKIPVLTTKKTAWKTGTRELLWFIKGQTDNKILTEQGVGIWKGNTTVEFWEKCGLDYEPGRWNWTYVRSSSSLLECCIYWM